MPNKTRTEQLEFSINKVTKACWNFYKKYHYLNETCANGDYYELTLNDKKVGFIAINKFPHPIVKNIFSISRLVIVPEFQGFSLGIKFINEIAKLYQPNRVHIVTSLKPFIKSLEKNKKWKCCRFGRVGKGVGQIHNKKVVDSSSNARVTATFEFINE